MRAKKSFVELQAGAIVRKFEFSHAERLLRVKNSGWSLPENSRFEFVGNGLRKCANKRTDTQE